GGKGSQGLSPLIGQVTSQGDRTHRGDDARTSFGVTGAGVKIGVLSDSFNNLPGNPAAADVRSGDLPGPGNPDGYTTPVTVLQDSFESVDEDEGRAMLQIIHDVAPGAQLFFATALLTPANFAQNIRNLRNAGCDIIVDDVMYPTESPFQEGQVPGVSSDTN